MKEIYRDFWRDIEETEHCVHVNEWLSNLSVYRTQKVQRERQLEEEAIHHHKVTHSHCSLNNKNK